MSQEVRRIIDHLRRDLESIGTVKNIEDCGLEAHLRSIQIVSYKLKDIYTQEVINLSRRKEFVSQ